jgi:hypothetical protein
MSFLFVCGGMTVIGWGSSYSISDMHGWRHGGGGTDFVGSACLQPGQLIARLPPSRYIVLDAVRSLSVMLTAEVTAPVVTYARALCPRSSLLPALL